ncbi:MAG: conjugal transfer protein TraG N-terminal domain-containing protein [Cellvibrionaceae bacterium]|nr:conjugal transfer protein TraG N-terminal domain-containing protein [Cellvibrionaceae bacterium]
MQFTLYSIGDSAFLEQVMIALALLGGYGEYADMIRTGLLVGVLGVMVSAIAKGGKEIEVQHVLLGYLLWATMFVPTATVIIEDSYTGYTSAVDNVPLGPAAAGGIISLVGYRVTKMFEVAYDPIVPKATETEFAESLQILSKIRNNGDDDGLWLGLNTDAGGGFTDLQSSWFNYMKDCTLKKVDLGIMTAEALIGDPFEQSLRFDSDLFGTLIFLDPASATGQSLTCKDAWGALENVDTHFTTGTNTLEAFHVSLGLNSSNLPAGENAVSKTNNSLDALTQGGIAAGDYMKMAVLEPILTAAAAGKYNDLQDQSAAIMINQALQQRNTQWASEQTLFMSIVRPMLAFFEAFTYAVTPVMAFVMVLGSKGIALAGKYFLMVIWIQLWMPILSIINLYIHTVASRDLATYNDIPEHNWDSFYALNAGADDIQHWLATGGMLAASTPAIALMLVYGSSMTATHLAGRLKSQDTLDEKYVTPEATNTPPVLQKASQHTYDQAGGIIRSGDQIPSISYTSSLGEAISSSKAESQGITNQAGKTLSKDLLASESADIAKARGTGITDIWKTGHKESYKAVESTAASLVDKFDLGKGNQNAVESALSASISTSANGSLSFSPKKLQAALKVLGVNASAGFNAAANEMQSSGSKNTDTKSNALAQALSDGNTQLNSSIDEASLTKTLGSGYVKNDSYSKSEAWANSHSQKLSQDYKQQTSLTKGFEEQQKQENAFGQSNSMTLNQLSNLSRSSPQMLTAAHGFLQNKMLTNPTLKENYNNSLRQNRARFPDDDMARNVAMFQTLGNTASFGGDLENARVGTGMVHNIFNAANGYPQSELPNYNKNENVGDTPLGQNDEHKNQPTHPDLQDTQNKTSHVTPQIDHLENTVNQHGTQNPKFIQQVLTQNDLNTNNQSTVSQEQLQELLGKGKATEEEVKGATKQDEK